MRGDIFGGPKSREEIYNELAEIVGASDVSDNDIDKFCYVQSGATEVDRRVFGRMGPGVPPMFIVWPESTEEVVELVKLANEEEIPIIPYGGGRGGHGGVLPVRDRSVIIDMRKMDKILELSWEGTVGRVQAGIYPEVLDNELRKHGFFFPHDPQSFWSSNIGGMISTSAAGRLASKYGYIGDFVLALKVVLPNGKVLRTRPVMKSSAGPDLNWLFVGAEGTLGIVTEAWLKFYPLPDVYPPRTHAVQFKDFHSAWQAASRIASRSNCRGYPSMFRLSDENHVKRVMGGLIGLPEEEQKGALLFVGFDGEEAMVDLQERLALETCRREGGKDLGTELGMNYWNTRYTGYHGRYEVPREVIEKSAGWMKGRDSTIVAATTFDRVEPLHTEILNVFEKHGVWNAILLTHITPKGAALYSIFRVVDDDYERGAKLWRQVWDEGVAACHKYDGTFEHHHEIGSMSGKYMDAELGYGMEIWRMLKKELDPRNIMNPGKAGL